MYLAMLLALMCLFPLCSVLVEYLLLPSGADLLFLIGKWFVFWSVGLRLLIAGIRQIAQPAFTAETIFETTDPGARKIVTELGSANLCMGLIGALSVYFQSWVLPAAVCGGLYLGLAGFKHIANGHRNVNENAAMVSDLFVFAILLLYVVGSAI